MRRVLRVMQRLVQRRAHQPGRADDDVEARQVRHLDERRDAAPFLADENAHRYRRTRSRVDAFERLPNLSFRRWMKKRLRVPSGSERGTKKQVTPLGVRASVRNASLIGAEQNHLCPVSR